VVTLIGPLVAPAGTRAVREVPSLVALTFVLRTPLNLTVGFEIGLVLTRWYPETVIKSFTEPSGGKKPVMYGPGPITIKLLTLEPGLPSTTTVMGPVVAPFGTVAVIDVVVVGVALACLLFQKKTVIDLPLKPVPLMIT